MVCRAAALAALATTAVVAFAPAPLTLRRGAPLGAYAPEGMTPSEYQALVKKEKSLVAGKGGRMGARGFKSRSMKAFQEAMEAGEATHLMPTPFAKERVASGELKVEDIPYMQRGGSWDNSDLKKGSVSSGRKITKTVKTKEWRDLDYKYDNRGFKGTGFAEGTSVSIFGGGNMPWTGKETFENPMGRRDVKVKNVRAKGNFAAKKGMGYDPAFNANGAKQRMGSRPTIGDVAPKKTWGNSKPAMSKAKPAAKAGWSFGKKAAPEPEPVKEVQGNFFGKLFTTRGSVKEEVFGKKWGQ